MRETFICHEDFQPYADITKNVYSEKLEMYLIEAIDLDLEPVLGRAMLYDMAENKTAEKYVDLWAGKVYEDSDGNEIKFLGLTPALVHFTYARYVLESGMIDTPTGTVFKNSEYSERVGEAALSRKASRAESKANHYMDQVKEFLKEHEDDYPLYKTTGKNNNRGFAKINSIG